MRIVKILFYILILIGLTVFLIWLVFYSTFLANQPQIINIRNFYFDNLYRYGPKNVLYFTTRPERILNTDTGIKYRYKIVGKFLDIDYKNNIITIRNLNGSELKFEYSTNPSPSSDIYNILTYREEITDKNGNSEFNFKYFGIDKENPEKTSPYFKKDNIMVFYWIDSKKLDEVLKIQKSGDTINIEDVGGIPFVYVVNN